MKLLTDAEIENIKKLAYDNALADLRNATYTNDTETSVRNGKRTTYKGTFCFLE